ncbi:sentrin-specific protease 6 isoform 1-T1 [Synchiropus picturatus]
MAHNRGHFFEALERSETKRDGGFKHKWNFTFSGDSDEETEQDESVVSSEPTSRQENSSPEGKQFTSADSRRTYENKLSPKRLSSDVPVSVAASSHLPNRTNYLIISPAPSQGIVLQGRHFQHAQMPSATRSPLQRNSFSQQPQQQPVEVDNIVLTCPEPAEESFNIKRRVQQKRRPSEEFCRLTPQLRATQPVSVRVFQTVCGTCLQPCEDPNKCETCGDSPVTPPNRTPRPPIRIPSTSSPNDLLQSFHRTPRASATNDGSPLSTTATSCGLKMALGARRTVQKHKLNDPIILSSDDEADEGSTENVNRLDNVSPCPADSAHSSPAPSGGRVEAAVKSGEQQQPEEDGEELGPEFLEDMKVNVTISRRAKMKDQFGNQPVEHNSSRTKKPRVTEGKCYNIVLECRSVRVGTLRRMVAKPVIFDVDYILVEMKGSEPGVEETLRVETSEIVSCEWCNVRKLPVLFFQTSADGCSRLRRHFSMSREEGVWYDSAGDELDEKYIVLIFENGLPLREQHILEEILGDIGKTNNLLDFPSRLTFDEANCRLVNFHKLNPTESPAKTSAACRAAPSTMATRTRMSTRQHASASYQEEEEEDMSEIQPTFSGPVVKLMVYPPPPAKGGISVTNEDLHCLNDREFLNDVIIDFYLKYLVLEKLKKEEAQRIHVFSSFFYKRLNQRERRALPDSSNLPIPKRKHNRVKTWTRHVDLFQKDFIFVPINESAHWYLAVICFPGLEAPLYEPNPLYHTPTAGSLPPEDHIPDHCRPLSPDRDGLEDGGNLPNGPMEEEEEVAQEGAEVRGQEASNGQAESQFSSELQRIQLCYGAGDDPFTFSDDQSSCQDDLSEHEEPLSSDTSSLTSQPTICKQPCILIMDSLRGPARSSVIKTLREYLEVEWEVRKGTERSFGKDLMKGSSPRVPQQDNFSDCGVYVLQYVESFFQNPIPSFHLPLNLSDWFPQQRMKTKRQEIRGLILQLKEQQEHSEPTAAATHSSEDGEIQETASSA